MSSSSSDNNSFLSILLKPRKIITAFNLLPNSSSLFSYDDYNYFGFPEDYYSLEIRCPICLHRVKNASRPNICYHVYCRVCLKEWAKQSKKCPNCRATFSKIIKVSYSEPWVYEKYS